MSRILRTLTILTIFAAGLLTAGPASSAIVVPGPDAITLAPLGTPAPIGSIDVGLTTDLEDHCDGKTPGDVTVKITNNTSTSAWVKALFDTGTASEWRPGPTGLNTDYLVPSDSVKYIVPAPAGSFTMKIHVFGTTSGSAADSPAGAELLETFVVAVDCDEDTPEDTPEEAEVDEPVSSTPLFTG